MDEHDTKECSKERKGRDGRKSKEFSIDGPGIAIIAISLKSYDAIGS